VKRWLESFAERCAAWARTPAGFWVLMAISFGNSSVFPISPYYLLVPMVAANPRRWVGLSVWCAVTSVAGGVVGWWLGACAWDAVSPALFRWVPGFTPERVAAFKAEFAGAAFLGTLTLSISPLPYKVLASCGGVFGIPLPGFLLASLIGRGGRMLATGATVRYGAGPVRAFLRSPRAIICAAIAALAIGALALWHYWPR
jgi:membrane protein YqaA with SNARE-associated domain